MSEKINSIQGYPLFNDVEDKHTQRQNRAVILANIIEDNLQDESGVVTQTGMLYSLQYWDEIPDEEKKVVYEMLKREVSGRGLIKGGLS